MEKDNKVKEFEEDVKADIQKVQEEMNKIIGLEEIQKIIEDNIIEFEIKEKKYRVRKPTFKEKQEVYEKRCEKQMQLLREKDSNGDFKYLSEEKLIEMYKERGTDIGAMDRKIKVLYSQMNAIQEKLGKNLKEEGLDKDKDTLKKQIETLKEEIDIITIDKYNLLEFSIEKQIMGYIYGYFTSILTEKLEEGEWKRLWNSFDEFLNGEEEVINMASFYVSLITSDNPIS